MHSHQRGSNNSRMDPRAEMQDCAAWVWQQVNMDTAAPYCCMHMPSKLQCTKVCNPIMNAVLNVSCHSSVLVCCRCSTSTAPTVPHLQGLEAAPEECIRQQQGRRRCQQTGKFRATHTRCSSKSVHSYIMLPSCFKSCQTHSRMPSRSCRHRQVATQGGVLQLS